MAKVCTSPVHEAPARVLALMVAANGRVDPREVAVLDELDAFETIGIPRQRFVEMAHSCLREIGTGLAECSWLRDRDLVYVDLLLDAVTDPQMRLALSRMAAAVVAADGNVSTEERLVYSHLLARWHINQTMVTELTVSRGVHRA